MGKQRKNKGRKKEKTKEFTRKFYEKKLINLLQQSHNITVSFPFLFFLPSRSLSFFLSLKPEHHFSLTLVPVTPATCFAHLMPPCHHKNHPLHTRTQLCFPSRQRENKPNNCHVNRHLSSLISTTTGHHSRFHHDQKNYLEVLYTTVLTRTSFFTLKKSPFLLFIFFIFIPGYCFE